MNNKNLVDWAKLGRTLVVIDAANLEKSAKAQGAKIHYTHLKRFFQINADLIEIRFYSPAFGTPEHQNFLQSLSRRGYHIITKSIKEINDQALGKVRKANFDVEIAVDTLEHISDFDTLILFSGDSDFDYLVRRIRSRGKKVFVFSTRYHISKELISSCTQYFDIRKFKEMFFR